MAMHLATPTTRTVELARFRLRKSRGPRVAYLGGPGAFSEEAAMAYSGPQAHLAGYATFQDVFDAVEQGRADIGLVPIENCLAGSVYENYDLLVASKLKVVGEHCQRITLHLVAHPETSLREVREVFSHPIALGQCRRLLARHREWVQTPCSSTSAAVEKIMAGRRFDAAALASPRAAELFGATVLKREVQDFPLNFTRFLAISRHAQRRMGQKTTLVFSTCHVPGSLCRCLLPFARCKINVTKIESRPLP